MSLVVRLLLICMPITLAAQQPLQYTRLTAENGLSNNSVQCILQDYTGIVWIGTSAGLNRYDGSSFISYSVLSTPAITNNAVTALMQDENNYIWIGTDQDNNLWISTYAGLSFFDRDHILQDRQNTIKRAYRQQRNALQHNAMFFNHTTPVTRRTERR